ncbi:MAG: hypothetical protein DA328_07315 [Nitrososphaeraceae archaeon]|nr:hypothetical protein [Nitrososphaeraceae archaeon]
MLVKINFVSRQRIKVTQLDIDDYGSLLPLKSIPQSQLGESLFNALQNSEFAAIFTKMDIEPRPNKSEGNESLDEVILVNPISLDEINEEKRKVIESLKK